MATYGYTVHIDAPPAKVWQATIRVERWPEILPTFVTLKRIDSGPFAMGSSARIQPKGFLASTWTVTSFDDGTSYSWETKVAGMKMVARHVVQPDDGGTRMTLQLEVSGPFALLLAPAAGRIYRRNLKIEGDAMKKHCEGG